MKNENMIRYAVIVIYVLLLFFISNCIKISFLTQPKFFGIFIIFVLLFLLFTKRIQIDKHKDFNLIKSLMVGLLLFSCISFISVFINKKFGMTYIFEIIRPIIYFASVLIFSYVFNNSRSINFFNRILYIIIPLFFIINIIQFHNVGNINNLYIRVIAPTQYVTLVDGYAYPRVVGLMSNPNVYGYILSLFNLYLFYILFKNKEINSNGKNFLLIFLILINRLSMYLTGSRTAFLTSIISEILFVFFLSFLQKKQFSLKVFFRACVICFFILIGEFILMFIIPMKYSWRIKTIFSNNISSWEVRKEKTQDIINNLLNHDESDDSSTTDKENIDKNKINENTDNNDSKNDEMSVNDKAFVDEASESNEINNSLHKTRLNEKIKNIIIGVGPIKNGFAYDNEWVHIFVIYGVLGILSFTSIFVLTFLSFKKYSLTFKLFYISILTLNFIYMVSAGSFFSYNMFITFLMFMILVFMGEKYVEE